MDLAYNMKRQRVSTQVVHAFFYPFLSMLPKFQFVQKGKKEYSLRLNLKKQIKAESLIIQMVRREFGRDPVLLSKTMIGYRLFLQVNKKKFVIYVILFEKECFWKGKLIKYPF